MFNLIPKLNGEARQALFAAVAAAAARNTAEITPAGLAAALLRSPSAETICSALNIDREELLGDLDGVSAHPLIPTPRVPEGTTRGPKIDANSHGWQLGNFVAMPLSKSAETTLELTSRALSGVPAETVGPARVLGVLLEHDNSLRELCNRHGLTAARLRPYGK